LENGSGVRREISFGRQSKGRYSIIRKAGTERRGTLGNPTRKRYHAGRKYDGLVLYSSRSNLGDKAHSGNTQMTLKGLVFQNASHKTPKPERKRPLAK